MWNCALLLWKLQCFLQNCNFSCKIATFNSEINAQWSPDCPIHLRYLSFWYQYQVKGQLHPFNISTHERLAVVGSSLTCVVYWLGSYMWSGRCRPFWTCTRWSCSHPAVWSIAASSRCEIWFSSSPPPPAWTGGCHHLEYLLRKDWSYSCSVYIHRDINVCSKELF